MRLSVIVPTCNERDELTACLDALAEEVPDAEIIVVNGPSTDGTSGMVRDRPDVDVLLECASRNVNVARNAGLREASGEGIALLAPSYRVLPGWRDAVVESLSGRADLVSGPAQLEEAREVREPDKMRIFGGNLALTRPAVTALDGFDAYLRAGAAADLGQRIAGQDLHVIWHPEMSVRVETEAAERRQHRGGYGVAWQGSDATDWGMTYRSLAYRLVKNGGLRPRVLGVLVHAALSDGWHAAREVARGGGSPSGWVSQGLTVVRNALRGARDGRRARRQDRTEALNPHGLSQLEDDVVVERYAR